MDIATLIDFGFTQTDFGPETEIDLEYSRSVTVDGESVTVRVMQNWETKMWGISFNYGDINRIVHAEEIIDFMVDIRANLG